MRVYSFLAPSETAYNAAPVATRPVNPFLAVGEAPIRPLRSLERDVFGAARTEERTQPVIASFNDSFAWLNTHSGQEVTERLNQHLVAGGAEDLFQFAGLLNAANKGRKIRFAANEDSQLNYHRNYGQGVEALRNGDTPAAKIYFQRARREIAGFQGLGQATLKPVSANPFAV